MARNNRILLNAVGKSSLRVFSVIVLIVLLLTMVSCKSEEKPPESISAATENRASSEDLSCLEFSSYSGAFLEDGSNEQVENVLAILLHNQSDEFLDYATITYDVGGVTAEFVATGLPPGAKAWVLEKNRMTVQKGIEPEFIDCDSSLRNDAILTTDEIEVTTKSNTLTAKNVGKDTLNNTCVYYKNVHSDGNYLGGITYMIAFETLKPGESLKKASAHFSDESKIVRYSYQK